MLDSIAQKKDVLQAVDIFSDLITDDPASNSILRENEIVAEKINKNIFIKGSFNKNRCYIGEPVLLTFQLFTALQSTSTVVKKPYVMGFLSTPMRLTNETPQFRKDGGKQYRVFTILQWQLIPVKEGFLKIDSIRVDNKVKYKDGAGETRYYTGTISSKEIQLQVDPLPIKSMPADFSGLVGKFNLSVFPRSNNIPAGSNNSLQIEISGSGNINDGKQPSILWPDGVDSFAAKETVEIIPDSFPVSGRKIFEIPFVANKEGKVIIPSIQLSYFDPASRQYKLISSKPIELNILAPDQKLPPRAAPETTIRSNNFLYAYLGVAVLLLLLMGMWIAKTRTKKRKMEVQLPVIIPVDNIEQNSETDFGAELEKLNNIDDPKEFIIAFKTLLMDYLQAKMGTSVSLEEELVRKLRVKDVTLADEVQDLNNECNLLLYTPESLSAATRELMTAKLCDIREKADKIWT